MQNKTFVCEKEKKKKKESQKNDIFSFFILNSLRVKGSFTACQKRCFNPLFQ